MVKAKLAGWLLGPALRLTRGRARANPAQAQIRRQPRAVWAGRTWAGGFGSSNDPVLNHCM